MISKILKLQNVGLLQDATHGGAVALAQVTAIYADNGRGKSTLAAVLRACQLGDAGRLNARKTIDAANAPEVKFLLPTGSYVEFTTNAWTATLPDIVIFDSEFVEENIYSGFEVRADQRQSLLEFALGDQTVQLKKKIDQLTNDIATQTGKKTQAEKILTGFAKPYSVAQFVTLQPVPDAQYQIDALQKRIEAAKNIQQLRERKDPVKLAAIQFNVLPTFAVLKTQVHDIEKTAEALVKAHLAKHISQNNPCQTLEDWIGLGHYHYLSGSECPFCGQDIAGLKLIDAYRDYFNATYMDLKKRVNDLEAEIRRGLSDSKTESAISTAAINTARIEAWKDQLNLTIPILDDASLVATIKQIREQLLALVALKQKAPLEVVGFQAEIDALTAALNLISQAIARAFT
jgi:wobble nucleotide-excising tRNase